MIMHAMLCPAGLCRVSHSGYKVADWDQEPGTSSQTWLCVSHLPLRRPILVCLACCHSEPSMSPQVHGSANSDLGSSSLIAGNICVQRCTCCSELMWAYWQRALLCLGCRGWYRPWIRCGTATFANQSERWYTRCSSRYIAGQFSTIHACRWTPPNWVFPAMWIPLKIAQSV